MRDRKGASPCAGTRGLAEACNSQATNNPIVKEYHMAGQYLPYPADYDLEAELADERYERALRRITVDEVLAGVDHLIAQQSDPRKHPLFTLAKHILRHGGLRSSGRRSYVAEQLGQVFEDLIEDAIERLVQEELSHFGPWEE